MSFCTCIVTFLNYETIWRTWNQFEIFFIKELVLIAKFSKDFLRILSKFLLYSFSNQTIFLCVKNNLKMHKCLISSLSLIKTFFCHMLIINKKILFTSILTTHIKTLISSRNVLHVHPKFYVLKSLNIKEFMCNVVHVLI